MLVLRKRARNSFGNPTVVIYRDNRWRACTVSIHVKISYLFSFKVDMMGIDIFFVAFWDGSAMILWNARLNFNFLFSKILSFGGLLALLTGRAHSVTIYRRDPSLSWPVGVLAQRSLLQKIVKVTADLSYHLFWKRSERSCRVGEYVYFSPLLLPRARLPRWVLHHIDASAFAQCSYSNQLSLQKNVTSIDAMSMHEAQTPVQRKISGMDTRGCRLHWCRRELAPS